jgi:hypothetical protein
MEFGESTEPAAEMAIELSEDGSPHRFMRSASLRRRPVTFLATATVSTGLPVMLDRTWLCYVGRALALPPLSVLDVRMCVSDESKARLRDIVSRTITSN